MKLLLLLITIILCSCSQVRNRGTSVIDIPRGPKLQMTSPSNPNTPSTQGVKHTVIREYFDTTNSFKTDEATTPNVVSQRTSAQPKRESVSIETPAQILKSETITDEVKTEVSASWFDSAKAKLGALKPVMYIGIFLMLVSAAMFIPTVYAFVGSRTTQLMIGLVGLGMTILPTLIVGQENFILIIGVLAVAGYWFAHRHGELKGTVNALAKDVTKINQ